MIDLRAKARETANRLHYGRSSDENEAIILSAFEAVVAEKDEALRYYANYEANTDEYGNYGNLVLIPHDSQNVDDEKWESDCGAIAERALASQKPHQKENR